MSGFPKLFNSFARDDHPLPASRLEHVLFLLLSLVATIAAFGFGGGIFGFVYLKSLEYLEEDLRIGPLLDDICITIALAFTLVVLGKAAFVKLVAIGDKLDEREKGYCLYFDNETGEIKRYKYDSVEARNARTGHIVPTDITAILTGRKDSFVRRSDNARLEMKGWMVDQGAVRGGPILIDWYLQITRHGATSTDDLLGKYLEEQSAIKQLSARIEKDYENSQETQLELEEQIEFGQRVQKLVLSARERMVYLYRCDLLLGMGFKARQERGAGGNQRSKAELILLPVMLTSLGRDLQLLQLFGVECLIESEDFRHTGMDAQGNVPEEDESLTVDAAIRHVDARLAKLDEKQIELGFDDINSLVYHDSDQPPKLD